MGDRALIYTRVSQDRSGGRSPAEQEAEARQTCFAEGWEVVDVATDKVGASRHSKGTRPGWAKAQRMIEAGEVDILVTWEASRAQRDLAAYTKLRDLCVAAGVRWSYSGKVYDLADYDDRFRTGQDALMAEREAGEISHRVQRSMRANAALGRPHGRHLFGYRRVYDPITKAFVRQEPDPAEAPVVRRIFDEYLAGRGVRTIAVGLHNDGLTTRTGARWGDISVRRVLTNPGYAGRRVHRGEVVGDADWPALITADRFDLAQARLAVHRASGTRQRSTSHLLTSVARCGVCGGRVTVVAADQDRRVYVCKDDHHVGRDKRKLDGYISAIVVARLSRPDVTDALAGAGPGPEIAAARQRVDELRAQLDDAVDQFAAGDLTAATLAKVEQRLLPMIEAAERDARHAQMPGVELTVPNDDVAAWWDALAAEVRREIVGILFAAVVILSTTKGSRNFDPDAIRIEWRR